MNARLKAIVAEITEAAENETPAIYWLYGRENALLTSLEKRVEGRSSTELRLPAKQIAYDLSPLSAEKLANMLVLPHSAKSYLAQTSDEERMSENNVYRSYHNHWWVPTTVNGVAFHFTEHGEREHHVSACFLSVHLPPGNFEN